MKKEQILKSMESSLDLSLERFNEACDTMTGAKYILAAGKIAHLLLAIASSRPLTDFFRNALEGYNFPAGFERAKFRDEIGRPYIKPPADAVSQVKFVFCLLYAVDTEQLELKNLLHSFYTHPVSANEEFARFCEELIVPFRQNVNGLLTGKIVPGKTTDETSPDGTHANANGSPAACSPAAPNPETGETSSPDAETPESAAVTLNGKTLDSLNKLTVTLTDLIVRDAGPSAREREELLLICDSFHEAVVFGAPRTIKVMYIALKNTLHSCGASRESNRQLDELNAFMEEHGLL